MPFLNEGVAKDIHSVVCKSEIDIIIEFMVVFRCIGNCGSFHYCWELELMFRTEVLHVQ